LEVDVGLGCDLAGNDHQASRGESFSGHAAKRILRQACVEDGIGYLVGDLIGMPFSHRLGCKQKSIVMWQISFLQFVDHRVAFTGYDSSTEPS
jgi:hypothetical protein